MITSFSGTAGTAVSRDSLTPHKNGDRRPRRTENERVMKMSRRSGSLNAIQVSRRPSG
jgi:hypothetical protein